MAPLYFSAATSAALEADCSRASAAARADSIWATLAFLLSTSCLAWSTWAWLGSDGIAGPGLGAASALPATGRVTARVVAVARAIRTAGRTVMKPFVGGLAPLPRGTRHKGR